MIASFLFYALRPPPFLARRRALAPPPPPAPPMAKPVGAAAPPGGIPKAGAGGAAGTPKVGAGGTAAAATPKAGAGGAAVAPKAGAGGAAVAVLPPNAKAVDGAAGAFAGVEMDPVAPKEKPAAGEAAGAAAAGTGAAGVVLGAPPKASSNLTLKMHSIASTALELLLRSELSSPSLPVGRSGATLNLLASSLESTSSPPK